MKWSRTHLSAASAASTAHAIHRVRTCDTALSDAAMTTHHQSLPSHMDRPSLSHAWAHSDSSLTPLSLPCVRSLLLPFAVARPPLLTGEHHHRPPLFPYEPPWRTIVSAAASSTRSKLEPTALASGTSTSSVAASSTTSSPSPTAVGAPPASPSL
jgi:hypothetical protein